MDLVPGPLTASSIAGLEAVSVANIDSPTELNSIAGTTVGERRVCYQAVSNDNVYTVYYFDASDGSGASTPYVMAASGSGFWIASGGKYTNSAANVRGALASSSTVTGTQHVSTIGTGTPPLVVTSTTVVANLNASQLLGETWASPGPIGGTTPAAGAFTSLSATGAATITGKVYAGPNTTDDTTSQLQISKSGSSIQLRLERTGSSAGHAWLGADSGGFLIYNNAGTTKILTLSDAGALAVTGSAIIGTTIAAGSDITTDGQLQIDDASGGGGNQRALRFTNSGAGSKTNWRLGAQVTLDNAFEIGHSTAAGGSSYTTDLVVTNTGDAYFSARLGVVATGLSSIALLVVGESGTNPLAGSAQQGIRGVITGSTAATTSIIGVVGLASTAAGSFTSGLVSGGYFAFGGARSGSTVTRATGIVAEATTGASNNAGLCIIAGGGSPAFTGNYALRSESTLPSLFSGDVQIASGKALQLGNAYTATPPTCTGYVTLQDSTGTAFKVLVST